MFFLGSVHNTKCRNTNPQNSKMPECKRSQQRWRLLHQRGNLLTIHILVFRGGFFGSLVLRASYTVHLLKWNLLNIFFKILKIFAGLKKADERADLIKYIEEEGKK